MAGERVAILGASGRAAAMSARLAGWQPAAADLFGDRDLTAIAAWTPAAPYPLGLEAAALRLPESPWIYTGGLENQPALVDRIAGSRPLWGNPGSVLSAVRDPIGVARCLADHGLVSPECSGQPPAQAGERWLIKPLRSCGGRGIRWASADHVPGGSATDASCYYQRFVPGPSYAALYVAAGGRARLLGITRQLVGCAWTGARPFAYCGSIGPAALPEAAVAEFVRIGDALATTFALAGLFGIDVVVARGRVHVLEVNPRYTASVEVLECGLQRPLLLEHVQACRDRRLPPAATETGQAVCGKAILYTTAPVTVSAEFTGVVDRLNADRGWPPLADLPRTGTQVDKGRPLITVRAEAAEERAVELLLRQLAAFVRRAVDNQPQCPPPAAGGERHERSWFSARLC